MTGTPIVLWQMQPLWGLPNASPFCMKVETWLRMAGLPYERREITGPPKSKSGKIPYIERPDGSLLWDSSAILDVLTRERGVALDQHLSAGDRALGVLLQRTIEEDLYFLGMYERWVQDHNWKRTNRDYFGHMPWVVRNLIVPIVRRKVLAAAVGQGVSRLPEGLRIAKAQADVRAIAQLLGDKPFFFGKPSSYDAMAYSFLANMLWAPYESPIKAELKAHANLVAYCERMKVTYYADWKPAAS
jgi:glutathione S-transferase